MSERLKNETIEDAQYHFLLSERLDNALKLANISQQKLSDKLEVHPTTVTNWKKTGKNKKGIHYNMLKKIADILDVDVEYLYDPNHNLPDLSIRKSLEDEENYTKDYRALFDYLHDKGYRQQYFHKEKKWVIIDATGWQYHFTEKDLKKLDAKLQALIQYEILNNCTHTPRF